MVKDRYWNPNENNTKMAVCRLCQVNGHHYPYNGVPISEEKTFTTLKPLISFEIFKLFLNLLTS